jgi:hypothetical protein
VIDKRFNLANFAAIRNKRMVDIGAALTFILLYPFIWFRVKRTGAFLANCFKVLAGKMTWVGYAPDAPIGHLPKLKAGAIQPYNILQGYEPSKEVKSRINMAYAQHYTAGTDVGLLFKNFKFLGGV